MAEAPRFFIFHGEDEFTQRETLAALKARLGDAALLDLNTSRFDGQTVELGELLHACSSFPFLADRRLVIVEGLIERLRGRGNESARDALLDNLPRLPPTTRLVFLERQTLPAENSFLKLAADSPAGYARVFQVPKGSALVRWIRERTRARGGAIQPPAAALLAANVGEDLRLLEMEITKLLSFVNLSRPIEPADVELLTPYAAQGDIFSLVDAIGQRRGQEAVAVMRGRLEAGDQPLYLLAMIVRQVRLLIQVREKLGQGYRPEEISKQLELHPWVAGKLCQQANGYDLAQLEAIHRRLLDTDVVIKTGGINPSVALELLVVELAVAEE
jgi:DNA polymerase-3 subunit delta